MQLGHQLFKDYWHMACHRHELPADNDFLRLKTPVGDIIVFNDAGELIAFDNRCPHRGALIYDETYGNQPNTCKYHGWTYRYGKLIVPQVEQFKNCDISTANIKKYKLDWCGDFLFIGVEPQEDLYTQLDGITNYIENISFNINERADLSAYDYECYWPLALENALEPYHIGMVHPQTLATLQLGGGDNTFHGKNSIWKAPVENNKIAKQLIGLKRFFNIDFQYEGYLSIYIFPFTMISSTYGYSYSLQNFFPHELDLHKTRFMSRLLTTNLKEGNAQQIISPFFESSAAVNRLVFEEDHDACKRLPLDSWSIEPLKYMSSQEQKIAHFRASCKEAIDRA